MHEGWAVRVKGDRIEAGNEVHVTPSSLRARVLSKITAPRAADESPGLAALRSIAGSFTVQLQGRLDYQRRLRASFRNPFKGPFHAPISTFRSAIISAKMTPFSRWLARLVTAVGEATITMARTRKGRWSSPSGAVLTSRADL